MEKRVRSGRMSDVSDEEWAFVAPYLALCREDAAQRDYPLRDVFNALRYIAKTCSQWRLMPHDLPPWAAVYQQMRRWMEARCFEIMVEDLRVLLREFAGRKGQPSAICLDSWTLQSTPESGARGGYDGARAAQGIEGSRSGRYAGPSAGPARYRGREARRTAGGGQAHRGQTRFCAVAAPLGGGAQLRMGCTLPPSGQRLHERLAKTLEALHYLAFATRMLANLARQLTQSS